MWPKRSDPEQEWRAPEKFMSERVSLQRYKHSGALRAPRWPTNELAWEPALRHKLQRGSWDNSLGHRSSSDQRKLQQQDMVPFQPLESSLQSKKEENMCKMERKRGTFLEHQRLGLHTSNGGCVGLILSQGTKIPYATWHGQKLTIKNNNINNRIFFKWGGRQVHIPLANAHVGLRV